MGAPQPCWRIFVFDASEDESWNGQPEFFFEKTSWLKCKYETKKNFCKENPYLAIICSNEDEKVIDKIDKNTHKKAEHCYRLFKSRANENENLNYFFVWYWSTEIKYDVHIQRLIRFSMFSGARNPFLEFIFFSCYLDFAVQKLASFSYQ